MNNNKHTTEELLEKGKGITLSTDERDDIKAQLLSYAQYHGQKEQHSPRRFHATWWFRSASAFVVLLFALTGTGYASMDSLPGEPLYAMKVHVVEEGLLAMEFDEYDRFDNSVERIETRLGELRALEAKQQLKPEHIEQVDDNIDAHLRDIDEILAHNTEEQPAFMAKVPTVIAVVRATDRFIDTQSEEVSTTTAAQTGLDTAVSSYQKQLQSFSNTQTEEDIEKYIDITLAQVADELSESDVATSTREAVTAYLEGVQEELDAADITHASILAGMAAETILTEEYVNDFVDQIAE